MLVLANVGDHPVHIDDHTMSGLDSDAIDLLTGARVHLENGLNLPAWGFLWLQVTTRATPATAAGAPHDDLH